MKVDVAAFSDTGLVREGNEDSFLVDKDLFIFAVADGMGGHVAGEIASATAVEALRASTANGIAIEEAIHIAHDQIKQKSNSEEKLNGMGTTITALGFSKEKKLVIAHVGDSRAYVLHKQLSDDATNSENELVRLTKDHSLVEELVDAGQITQEEADVHPRRSVITRALGIDAQIEVDVEDIAFLKGDRFLLCSDGLTSMVRDEEILRVLKENTSPSAAAKELITRANKAGGNDNITVLIIDVLDAEVKAPTLSNVAQSIPSTEKEEIRYSKKGRLPFLIRIILASSVVVALFVGAYYTANHFAHQGYFLDQKSGQVVLMSGKYGGVLWWNPKLDTQTGIEVKDLSSSDKLLVERHSTFSSRKEALDQLEKIRKRKVSKEKSTSSTTTTISIPPTSTTPITISNGTAVSSQN
ncbi:MAG: Stp1/IreP family PP2C-type Ser/Thr phosphatase [Acidimicrobiia bacterium]